MKKLIYTLALALILNSAFLIRNCEAQWQTDVRLTNNPFTSNTSLNNAWCVAASGSVVHVVWIDSRDGNNEIYYKRSTDAGISWGADTRLTNNSAISSFPSVAVSGSVVHVVWEDWRDGNQEIYYKRSIDAGVSWEADVRMTNNPQGSDYSSVAVSGPNVYIVWRDTRDSNYEIYYKHSTNSGTTWSADTRLTNNADWSTSPSVSVYGSGVVVVWQDKRDGNWEVYYKRSIDGINWGADTRLTNNTFYSESPSVAVSGPVVHVVWVDTRDGNQEIYYKRSIDSTNWGADTRLTNNTANSYYPSVAVSGSVVHVIWRDNRDGNTEIYYKRSTDAGVNWGADTRLTNNTFTSENPSVAVSGSLVHVVWSDNREGPTNYEIYYKRDPTGNVGIQNISTEIPSKYSLSQNYPNPFNPTTKIKFDVVRVGDVKIVVYDVMGREVQTLVNESLKPGTYEASFDASQLTSGVYFYKITAGDFSETKKMLMIK